MKPVVDLVKTGVEIKDDTTSQSVDKVKDDGTSKGDNTVKDDTTANKDNSVAEKNSDETKEDNVSSNVPKTGDKVVLWISILFVSTIATFGMFKFFRKRD